MPFIFNENTKDASLYLDGNPDYWKRGVVNIGRLVFEFNVDAAARLQKIRTGDCQVMSYRRPIEEKLRREP